MEPNPSNSLHSGAPPQDAERFAASAGSAVFMWDISGLAVLIPRRRGIGFLKCPLGHHRVQELAQIEMDEGVDMCGLDGYLAVGYGYKEPDEQREIEARILPRLAAHFGFSAWREDRAEFWRILQPNARLTDEPTNQ